MLRTNKTLQECVRAKRRFLTSLLQLWRLIFKKKDHEKGHILNRKCYSPHFSPTESQQMKSWILACSQSVRFQENLFVDKIDCNSLQNFYRYLFFRRLMDHHAMSHSIISHCFAKETSCLIYGLPFIK